MATEKQLHDQMKTLEAHFADVRKEAAEMSDDQRVELGKLLEEFSERLYKRGK